MFPPFPVALASQKSHSWESLLPILSAPPIRMEKVTLLAPIPLTLPSIQVPSLTFLFSQASLPLTPPAFAFLGVLYVDSLLT